MVMPITREYPRGLRRTPAARTRDGEATESMNTDDHIIDANGSWSSPQEALEWYRRELATTGLSRESWKAGMQWAETQLFWFESAFRNVVGVLSDHAAAGNANPAGIDMAALTVSLLGPPDDAPLPPGLKSVGLVFEVCEERSRQDVKWGGPDHDAQHEPADWAEFIAEMARMGRTDKYRRRLIQVAALALAAAEALDRRGAS